MTVTCHSTLVKLMLPSESSLDIVLMAVIMVIVIFYAILLVKLKPSKETESPSIRYLERNKETPIEPKRLEEPTKPAETKKATNAKQALSVEPKISTRPQKTSKEAAMEVEDKKGVQTKTPVETEEKQKMKKDEEAKKSFLLFGERNFEGCPHKYGYLCSLPKNTPIPDECFGCPRIVECLRTSKNK